MRFLTLVEQHRANGDRHAANAARYLREGLPSYAQGSWRKAERNYERAEELEKLLTLPPWGAEIMTRLRLAMEENLYHGDQHGLS